MTPIEQYEAQQRALETGRAARINADLQRDALASHHYADGLKVEWNEPTVIKAVSFQTDPAPFCAPYGEKDAEPGALVWLCRILFVLALAAAFYTAARLVMP